MVKLDVFLDIDGCLINSNYEFTAPLAELRARVNKYSANMNLNINSNRSLQNILDICNKLNFNGLLVYENGQGIFDPIRNIDFDSVGIAINRKELIDKLLKISDEVSFISTDELLRNPQGFSSLKSKVIFCEKTRNFTATIYPRIIQDRVPIINLEFLKETEDFLMKKYGLGYNVRSSNVYGNVILTPHGALKSNPMQKIAKGNLIASFGDEFADTFMFKESTPTLIGCPANASDEVKDFVNKNGGLVSNATYTAGVLNFLDYLNEKTSGESL